MLRCVGVHFHGTLVFIERSVEIRSAIANDRRGAVLSKRSCPRPGPLKPRRLDEPIAVKLDDLVPADHVYRPLEVNLCASASFATGSRSWTRSETGRASPWSCSFSSSWS
jgi:hypothetical protein